MFGLERIGWLVFLKVILIILILWYLVLFISYWWQKSYQSVSISFEKDIEEEYSHAELNAFNSEKPMPLGYVTPIQVPGVALVAENLSDLEPGDGVALEQLTEGKGMTSEAFLEQKQIIR